MAFLQRAEYPNAGIISPHNLKLTICFAKYFLFFTTIFLKQWV